MILIRYQYAISIPCWLILTCLFPDTNFLLWQLC